jgi:hypothetical protein
MSLSASLAVLAEGAAPDARGNMSLIAANPPALIADQLPAQFTPIFYVIAEDEDPDVPTIIIAGRTIEARVEAKGPDGEVVFFAQFRQPVIRQMHPVLPPRVQLLAQIPFTAAKTGSYQVSARVAILDEDDQVSGEVVATRSVRVMDQASLSPKSS